MDFLRIRNTTILSACFNSEELESLNSVLANRSKELSVLFITDIHWYRYEGLVEFC